MAKKPAKHPDPEAEVVPEPIPTPEPEATPTVVPGVVEVTMLDLGNPKWEVYSGYMTGATGKAMPLTLRPGVHVLPTAKAEQLCRDFPFLFTMETAPKSSASSSEVPTDTSTDSSGPVAEPTNSGSEV